MEKHLYDSYVNILREELVPAMGCTEPIAVAYAASIAANRLGMTPERVDIEVSPNILKNVKSVFVPNTGGLRGIEASAAAGIVAGNPEAKLEVIASATPEQQAQMAEYLQTAKFSLHKSESGFLFDIDIRVYAGEHCARCRIAGSHTNVIHISKDGVAELDEGYTQQAPVAKFDRSILNVERIVEFAQCVEIEDVKAILDRQVSYNMAIAEEGLRGNYGACIGKVLLSCNGTSTQNRAKAYAAAASDARMNGCSLPVVINSGSGNQGLTASVPVVIYARDMAAGDELMYRSLVVANLVTTHLKTGIGPLSAYCGAVSAGCGAAAGVTYMRGGRYNEIAHTIVNALAIDSGMICDGAKSSCAAKIASAVEAGILGMQMYENGTQFYSGDGIVTKGVENTIANVGRLARQGMAGTDKEIIDIMISPSGC